MRTTLFCIFFLFASAIWGDTARIIATGDSLTVQYSGYLPTELNNHSIDAVAPNMNFDVVGSTGTYRNGLTASLYVGDTARGGEAPIDFADNVLSADPDLVFFMLGINNVPWTSGLEQSFGYYQLLMSPVFDEFSNFTNSRGQHPRIVIGSILPFDVEKNEAYQSLINHHTMTRPPNTLDYLSNTWNPWLADQAAQRGFTYLDNFAAVQQIPNWKGTLLNQSDGLHLSAAGADWVASRFVSVLVPEPSTIALVGTAVIGLLAWSLRRRKV